MPNVLQVPAICGTRYTALSIARMAEMASPVTNPFPIAIYSLSLPLAKQVSTMLAESEREKEEGG